MCEFNDDECKEYTLAQLEKFSKDRNEDGVNLDDEDMEDEDEVVEIDDDGDNEDVATTDRPPQEILSGKLMKQLLRVPPGMTPDQHLAELKSRNTAHQEYRQATKHPQKIVEERFKRLELDGRPVVVSEYDGPDDVQILVDALSAYDPGYNASIRSKTQLGKVPHIKAFLESSDHCRMTPFTLEYKLCRRMGVQSVLRLGEMYGPLMWRLVVLISGLKFFVIWIYLYRTQPVRTIIYLLSMPEQRMTRRVLIHY